MGVSVLEGADGLRRRSLDEAECRLLQVLGEQAQGPSAGSKLWSLKQEEMEVGPFSLRTDVTPGKHAIVLRAALMFKADTCQTLMKDACLQDVSCL